MNDAVADQLSIRIDQLEEYNKSRDLLIKQLRDKLSDQEVMIRLKEKQPDHLKQQLDELKEFNLTKLNHIYTLINRLWIKIDEMNLLERIEQSEENADMLSIKIDKIEKLIKTHLNEAGVFGFD